MKKRVKFAKKSHSNNEGFHYDTSHKISKLTNHHSSLKKECDDRPNYEQLLKHPFIQMYEEKEVDVAGFVTRILEQYADKKVESS